MAFIDRIVDYPNRFTLTDSNNNVTGPYTLTRDEGEVTTVGTLLNASTLNTEVPRFYLDTAAQAGTTDGDLYAAITGIGWDAETVDNNELITKKVFEKLISTIQPLFNPQQYIDDVSAPSGTNAYMDNIFVAPSDGYFIGRATVTYQTPSSTGRRVCNLMVYDSGARNKTAHHDVRPSVSGANTVAIMPVYMGLTAGQGISVLVYQNSGSAVTCAIELNGAFLTL